MIFKEPTTTLLGMNDKQDYEWVCNECNTANFTSAVSEEEIELEYHSCITCGAFEFHKRPIKTQ